MTRAVLTRARAAVVAGTATATTRLVLDGILRGGGDRWSRENHRGRPVSLLEGPAVGVGLLVGGMLGASGNRAGLAVATATAGGAVFGLVDDLAVLALTLERLSRFATPRVRLRARRMAPEWLSRRDEPNTQPKDNQQGAPHDGQEEDRKTGRGSVPFIERFRILP